MASLLFGLFREERWGGRMQSDGWCQMYAEGPTAREASVSSRPLARLVVEVSGLRSDLSHLERLDVPCKTHRNLAFYHLHATEVEV